MSWLNVGPEGGTEGVGAADGGRGTSAGAGAGRFLSLMNLITSALVRLPLGPDP